ncbi:MAG TPA: DNA polymerase Y family protein [Actinocrinis sp.]|nr:DNA polymerase Y family protein [Actinocrinis sp.]
MEHIPPRTLVLWCPDWPVIAAGADLDAPAAVLEGEGARRVVVACSPAARESGVRRGQRIRDAQRMCPALAAYPRDPARESREFEPVVAAAEELAAAVEVVRPGLIALSAHGPARYHRGEARLAVLFRDAVAQLTTASGSPIGCGVGVADGMFAAGLAARRPGLDEPLVVPPGSAPAFLAPYPVAALERPDLAGLLDRLGVRTLGDFAALPAADVANRFGADGVLAHRLASGLDPRPRAPRRPAEDLSAVHEFDPPAERDEAVVFAAKALADRLHAMLGAAGLTCVRLGVEMSTASGRTSFRLWRHGDALGGSLSSLAVAERVRWQLDGWRTREAGVGAGTRIGTGGGGDHGVEAHEGPGSDPVVFLSLIPDQLVTDTGAQQALWGREEVPDRVQRAAERVQAALGHGGVARLYLVGGRDPAARATLVPWGDLPDTGVHDNPDAPWPGSLPPPAPSLVPPEPFPAELRDAAGGTVSVTGRARLSAPPAALAVLGQTLRITGWAGPWPYDERHWDPATRRRRARVQCSTDDGRAWLLAVEGGAWRVEGVYQ